MKRPGKPYPALRLIAARDEITEGERTAVRAALEEPLRQLANDMELTRLALGGVDPEYAVFLLVQVLDDLPGLVAGADRALAAATPTRRRAA